MPRLDVDAIVNAANERLLGGGGVDGAIHDAAGPELLDACRAIPQVSPGVRCPVGEVRITPGFALRSRFVIHTVGPVWSGGDDGEAELLAACYRNALTLARDRSLTSIAFPAISCGVFGYPLEEAAAIAVREVRAAIDLGGSIERVCLVAWGDDTYAALERAYCLLDAVRQRGVVLAVQPERRAEGHSYTARPRHR